MVAEPESSTENPAAAEVAAAAAAAAKLSPEEQQKLNTALYEATGDGKLEEAKATVNAGADVSSKHFESTTPALHPAAARGHLSVVKLLVLHKTDLDAQSVASGGDGGRTPLMYASMWGQIDVINELLRAGANKNIKANSGMTALDWTGKYRATRENRDAIIAALS